MIRRLKMTTLRMRSIKGTRRGRYRRGYREKEKRKQ
jgi:hypothetical protein